jgi:LacI family transcriptional regulator
MRVKIQDVAQRAGVGVGTVSRVLNNSPLVSDATRQRVLTAISELNYVPNPSARRLSLGRTLLIAVIAPFFTRPSVVERLRGIEQVLAGSPYDLIIYNVETPERRDEIIRELPRRDAVDGVIIVSLAPQERERAFLLQSQVPMVLLDSSFDSAGAFSHVLSDDVRGGELATRHLIELGHRRIGYISDRLDNSFNFTSSRDRYQGYRRALETVGIAFRPSLHGQGAHGRPEARRLARAMLSLPERPTAIFAASDTQAMGVLEAARDLSLQVPEDLSLVGYDDIEVAEYLNLSTIRQLLYESGRLSVELLLRALEEPQMTPVRIQLPTELVLRRTTAAPVG